MELEFYKYHGLGNDYLVYDCKKNNYSFKKEEVCLICDRNFGLGSDGILVGPIYENDTIGVKILNPDGSEAEKSGNGVRIFSKFLKDAGYTLASGSSSCAAAGAVYRLGSVDSEITVHMPGGSLTINVDEDFNVTMTGDVCSVGKMLLSEEFISDNKIGL